MNIRSLKKKFKKNINISSYLKKKKLNKKDIIKLSYDIQSGSYIKSYDHKKSLKVLSPLINEISKYNPNVLLDFGSGELTNFYTMSKKLGNKIQYLACDLSFSRLAKGIEFLKKNSNIKNKTFFVNKGLKLPFKNNSIDVITTCHALEPNKKGGAEIIKELYRVCKNAMVLFEPDYKIANDSQKYRMNKYGYIKNIEKILRKNNYKYKKKETNFNFNSNNPASIFIIEKKSRKKNTHEFSELYKEKYYKLNFTSEFYYSECDGSIYPILNGIVLFNNSSIYVD